MSSCWLLAMLPWLPWVLLEIVTPTPIPSTSTPASTAIRATLN